MHAVHVACRPAVGLQEVIGVLMPRPQRAAEPLDALDAQACSILLSGASQLSSLTSFTLETSGESMDAHARIGSGEVVTWLLAHTQRLKHLCLSHCGIAQLPPVASLVRLELDVKGRALCAVLQYGHLLTNLQALQLSRFGRPSEKDQDGDTVRLEGLVHLRTVDLIGIAPDSLSLPEGCTLNLYTWGGRIEQDVARVAHPTAVVSMRVSQRQEPLLCFPPVLLACKNLVTLGARLPSARHLRKCAHAAFGSSAAKLEARDVGIIWRALVCQGAKGCGLHKFRGNHRSRPMRH